MQQGNHSFTQYEIVRLFDPCLNKTLGEVDSANVFDKTKTSPKITGIAGDVIEQSILGYPADNVQAPDITIDGVPTEVKVTGIRWSKKENGKFEAKEPMSITAVRPKTIDKETFEESAFWHKLEHMLLVYYLYDSSKTVTASEYADFPIKGYQLHEFDDEDKTILKNDWQLVHDFLADINQNFENPENEYPRLSSELRNQLCLIDTAPKYPHPPRFRLKRSAVNAIIQEHFGERLEQLPQSYTSYNSVDLKCHEVTELNKGKTVQNIVDYYEIPVGKVDKSIAERLIINMFDGKAKKMSKIKLFNKLGLLGKTVVLTKKGSRTEDMQLFCIDFDEFTNDEITFEESSFFEYFNNHQLLCMVFEEPSIDAPLSSNKFLGIKRLSFDDAFIEQEVKPCWLKIKNLVCNNKLIDVVEYDKEGNPRRNKKTNTIRSAPNFPKSKDGIVFVRGKGIDSTYKPEQVNGISMYRQWVWVKGSYIADRLCGIDWL